MQRRPATAHVALLATLGILLLVPAASAAITPDRPYDAVIPFVEAFGEGESTVVSGALEATFDGVEASFGFVGAFGFRVDGLTRACWGAPAQCVGGDISILSSDGADVGLHVPGPVSGTATAAHALGFFQDFNGRKDLVDFGLGQALVASLVEGAVAFTDLPTVPSAGTQLDPDRSGGVVTLSQGTRLVVRHDGRDVGTIDAPHDPVFFEGAPVVRPFASDAAVLPMVPGTAATWRPADGAAAQTGLEAQRVADILASLDMPDGIGAFEEMLDSAIVRGLLNGATMTLPGEAGNNGTQAFAQDLVLVRFTALETAGGRGQVQAQGQATLILAGGNVVGAGNLVGVGWFALPWWSIVLWVVALGLWITRLVVKPPKTSPRWAKLRWIGWVVGPLVGLLILFLWDREVHHILGVSVLRGGASGGEFWGVLLVELGILSLVMFAAAVPLRMILSNALRLGKQGRFMGLPGPVGSLAGFFLGLGLLLSYLEYMLLRALAQAS